MFSPIANCKWCTSILSAGKQCSYLIKWTFDIINALKTAKMASLWSSTHVLNLFSDFNIKIHAAFWVAPTTSLKWVHIFHLMMSSSFCFLQIRVIKVFIHESNPLQSIFLSLFPDNFFIDDYARFSTLSSKKKNGAVANSMNYMTKKGMVRRKNMFGFLNPHKLKLSLSVF